MADVILPTIDKNLLHTGRPGCGKTTVLAKLAERLAGRRLAGSLTLEIKEAARVSFEAIRLSGRREILAHVRSHSTRRVGRYGVKVERLEPLIEEELERPESDVDVFLVDEIGKIERLSSRFVAAVRRI
jgi:nucleoside-triphosphatase